MHGGCHLIKLVISIGYDVPALPAFRQLPGNRQGSAEIPAELKVQDIPRLLSYKFHMETREHWQQYFKPETQKAGDDLVAEKCVVLTVTSDTAINGFVRGGGNSKVSFVSSSIGSEKFAASCSCTRAGKGVFCKHIWAVLIATAEKHPDFLDSKSAIEMRLAKAESSTAKGPAPTSASASTYQEKQKEKQAEFKKAQADRLKARNKDLRLAKKALKNKSEKGSSKFTVSYPEDVQEALAFFNTNGFSFASEMSEEGLKDARKILSRVFHPDKGGTHEESLLLNQHFDILMEYLKR